MKNPTTVYKIFFDRSKTSIDGVLTLQDGAGNKIIDRIHVRSGAKGYEGTDWERGKSPIPEGIYWLTLESNNKGAKAGAKGIGEAFPISSNGDGMRIEGNKAGQLRTEIMLHEENAIKGSAGCIVVVNKNDWANIMSELEAIKKEGHKHIRLEVC